MRRSFRDFKDAGAVLLGKVNTHEFAFGATTQNIHGRTANPWDTARIPGGSSGGSGAAVAAALAPFSIGSDTAGSIRLPAAFCGVVGFKPTYGLVSAVGVVPQSYTSDHIGPLARHIEDVATVMAVLAEPDPLDPTSDPAPPPCFSPLPVVEPSKLRVGIPIELMKLPCDPSVDRGFQAACDALRALGAELREISLPLLARASEINRHIILAETAAQHIAWQRGWFAGRDIRYHDDVADLLARGAAVAATDFVLASHDRAALRAALDKILVRADPDGLDLLITPTVPITAPRVGAATVTLAGQERDFLDVAIHHLCPFSLTGLPALSVPAGFSEDGLPVAVQLVGGRREDPTVLAVGAALGAVLGVRRRPRLATMR